ncbi:hypothetical protein TRAPUB_5763 [Trametes pubescens]|uniref:Uncharacterized protein n=1 Tax=Trametes pubescens TaxID=154538 RepID=A0A1M2V7S2_TRAPU|nr:hypothetical protein TRAPUB_5763 [Trametes pubescens]
MISDAGVDEPSALLEFSGQGLASPLAEDYALAAFHYCAAASPLGADGCTVAGCGVWRRWALQRGRADRVFHARSCK